MPNPLPKMYTKTTLHNGLTVVTYHMPGRVSVALGVWVKVGSRYEHAQMGGVSHFLEHLLFKGTTKRNCEEIKQAIEGIGGSLNGFTTEEVTCYLAKVPGKYLNSALDVLGDMVLNARMAGEDIEMERKVVLEEIRMYKDLPGHFVLDLLNKLLWPEHPLGRNIAGERESIIKLNKSQLNSFKQRFYRLNNIVVVACGDLKHEQLVKECRKCLLAVKKSAKNKFSPAGRSQQQHPQVKFEVKDTEQTHLALGLPGLSRMDPRHYILVLLHIILGANMSSRLFREVREKRGLAYEIGTSLKSYQDTGAFIVHAGIDNRRIVEALDVILQQLEEIKRQGVDAQELNRAKEYYIGQLRLALEDTLEHMFWLGEKFITLNRLLWPEEIIRKIKKIEADDLKKLAGDIFVNQKLNLALIGPLTKKDQHLVKKRTGTLN